MFSLITEVSCTPFVLMSKCNKLLGPKKKKITGFRASYAFIQTSFLWKRFHITAKQWQTACLTIAWLWSRRVQVLKTGCDTLSQNLSAVAIKFKMTFFFKQYIFSMSYCLKTSVRFCSMIVCGRKKNVETKDTRLKTDFIQHLLNQVVP